MIYWMLYHDPKPNQKGRAVRQFYIVIIKKFVWQITISTFCQRLKSQTSSERHIQTLIIILIICQTVLLSIF